ncbi:MAG TPA: hypothetical protein VG675_02815 [Bryobacteraceae bacterium]|nr:hypothetical protein [Bryobacteraceae bacterium]
MMTGIFRARLCTLFLGGCLLAAAQSPANLLQNPSFENALPGGWSQDPSSAGKGLIYRSEAMVEQGKYSLRMFATRLNSGTAGGDLGVTQTLPVTPYLGKPLYFSAWMNVKGNGPATALVRLIGLTSSGNVYFRQLKQDVLTDRLVFHQDLLDVPNDPTLIALFLDCSVQGSDVLATFDNLVVSDDPSVANWPMGQFNPGPDLDANVVIHTDEVVRRIPSTLYGMNLEWVNAGQGLWDDTTGTFNPDALDLAQNLGSSLWRFPGGLFADYYHWRDGVGPPDQRPADRPGPVDYSSTNSFGTDEALQLAQSTGGTLIITVNPLTGTPQEAADWVAYVNNGQRRVDRWEVGNEMYLQFPADSSGPYVLGAPTIEIPPADYAQRLIAFAQAMKAVDPTIKIGADVEFNVAVSAFRLFPDWVDQVLKLAGNNIDFLSVHNGLLPGLTDDAGWDVRTVYSAMLASPILLKNALAELSNKIDTEAGPNAPNISIGITEWGPLFQTDPQSRFIDHVKTLGSTLFAADLLKTLIENTRTDVACAFKFIDGSTQGWVGPRDGVFVAKAPYYALQMFTHHFGPNLVETDTQSPTYDTRSIGWAEAVQGVPYLDVVSSVDDTRNTLYIIAINKHFDRAITANIDLGGFSASGQATAWTLDGTAIDANTGTSVLGAGVAPQAVAAPDGQFENGGADQIWVNSTDLNVSGTYLQYEFPAHSITAIVIQGNPASASDSDSSSDFSTP